jgi:uncharacterized protein YfaP (DUF2135 family)
MWVIAVNYYIMNSEKTTLLQSLSQIVRTIATVIYQENTNVKDTAIVIISLLVIITITLVTTTHYNNPCYLSP